MHRCNGKKSHDQIFVITLRSESCIVSNIIFLRNCILEKWNGQVGTKKRCENVNWQEGCSQTSSLIAATFLPDPAQDITTASTPRSQICGVLSSVLCGYRILGWKVNPHRGEMYPTWGSCARQVSPLRDDSLECSVKKGPIQGVLPERVGDRPRIIRTGLMRITVSG